MTRKRIALLPLARATFDVPLAEQVLQDSLATLAALDVDLIGSRELLFDANAAQHALSALRDESIDLVLLLQITFTDATMTVAAAEQISAPIAIWATPEPRSGGRLRLNALCGLNLAAHALGKRGLAYDGIFASADDHQASEQVRRILAAPTQLDTMISKAKTPLPPSAAVVDQLQPLLVKLRDHPIGRFGQHPDGFDTCAYDVDFLSEKLGVTIEPVELDALFDRARQQPDERVAGFLAETTAALAGVGELEPDALDKSLRLYGALSDTVNERDYAAIAVRCWPEMFTDFGCAACGAMARLNQEGLPAACEADVDGAITALALQELAGSPALITDLVDVDTESDTAVLWHCGLAPLAMADPSEAPSATIHSNRQKPLLNQFAFRPGEVTLARLSKAKNQPKLVIARAEMIRAPRPYSGTAGTLRFTRPVSEVLAQILHEGLEHHYAFVYGDVRSGLQGLAAHLDIPVLELGQGA